MLQEDDLKIGVITSTHGLKGEVKVFPTTDDLGRFSELTACKIVRDQSVTDAEAEGCKFFKNQAILKFVGIDSIEEAEKIKGAELYVDRAHAVALEEGEFFIADIMGAEVFDEDTKLLGTLEEVLETGANDVYVIKLAPGVGNGKQKELLLPAIPDCLLEVDTENKKLVVRLLKGLLEE